MKKISRKGQGSFLSGDMPAIIMIVLSISFFLSSIALTLNQFESAKQGLQMQSALVDASSAFLKENAKINPSDMLTTDSVWEKKISELRDRSGVSVYMELTYLDPNMHEPCASSCTCEKSDPCTAGDKPSDDVQDILTKRFPVALQKEGGSELEVYPALVKVSVY